MIRKIRMEGMETVTSLLLLIISAILVFGVLSFLDLGENDDNDRDLIRLRSFQAKCLGEVLVSTYSISLQYVEDDSSISDAVVVWDGEGIVIHDHGRSPIPLPWTQALSTTPEGLTSALIFGDGNALIDGPSGEFVTWSHSMEGGDIVRIYLSVHVGSLHFGGVLG
ncbi:MAG: hypothetical protein ACMUHM_00360 [Thermoplasmatota archaeon]